MKINPSTWSTRQSMIVLIILQIFVSIFIFWDFITAEYLYLFKDIGSDTINYTYPQFVHLARYLRMEGIPAWSFNQGIGQNVFPFSIGEPFADILYLAGEKTLHFVIIWMELLKIFLGGIFFFMFLRKRNISPVPSITGGLLYSFSSYMIIGGSWYQFSTEAVYASLLLYAFELFRQDGKWYYLPIPFALIGAYQPFNLYLYGIFTVVYAIARDASYFPAKKIFRTILLSTVLAVFGSMLTGYFTLPNIQQYIFSPRFTGEASLIPLLAGQPVLSIAPLKEIITFIARLLSNDLLGNGVNFSGSNNYLESPLVYSGILPLLLFPFAFSFMSRKRRVILITLSVLIILPMFIPYMKYSFWLFIGFYNRTYSFFVSLWILVLGIYTLDRILKRNFVSPKQILFSLAFWIPVLILIRFYPGVEVFTGIWWMVLFTLILYSIILLLASKTNNRNLYYYLLLFCILEISFFTFITVNARVALKTTEIYQRKGYNDYTIEALQIINRQDSSFFRISRDYHSGLAMHQSLNDGKIQNYYGLTSYHSFNQLNYVRYLSHMNFLDERIEETTRWIVGPYNRPIIQTLLNTKYMLVKDGNMDVSSFNFIKLDSVYDITIYRNLNYLPLGYSYDRIITESEVDALTGVLQKDIAQLRACVIPDDLPDKYSRFPHLNPEDIPSDYSMSLYKKDINHLREDTLRVEYFDQNQIIGRIKLEKSKILFLSIPFDPGWSVSVNEEIILPDRMNFGFIGFELSPGDHLIELKYSPPWRFTGGILSIISVTIFAGLIFLNIFKNKYSETA